MVPRSVWVGILLAALFTLGTMIASNLYPTAVLGSGFLAQLLCSSTFVSSTAGRWKRRSMLLLRNPIPFIGAAPAPSSSCTEGASSPSAMRPASMPPCP